MILDFSFALVVATLVTGLIWAADAWYFRPIRVQRAGALAASGPLREPVIVEYARSFFPIILIVLLHPLLSFRAVSYPFRFDDANAARRGFHLREQVHLRAAAAGGERRDCRSRRSRARGRGRVPPAVGPIDELHQAPRRPAGRPHRGRGQAGICQRRPAAGRARRRIPSHEQHTARADRIRAARRGASPGALHRRDVRR